MLFSYQIDLPTSLIVTQVIREEFGRAANLSLDVYYEYLDLNRFPNSVYQKQQFDLFTAKYKSKQVDLVIVSGETMLNLWLAQRAEILPNTPISFFDITTDRLAGLNLPADATGVTGVEDYIRSVQWVLDKMPAINEIVIVHGVGRQADSEYIEPVLILQEKMKGQIKFTDLSVLPLSEIKQRVAKLPKTSIILYHLMFEDVDGNKYRPIDALRELAAVSSVPVISGYDHFIQTGTIGGYVYSIDQQARDAVQISLRVLRGEAVSTIPIVKNRSNRFIFDHLALLRFGIPLSFLPPDSIIKNRQYSVWELYRTQIILVAASFAFLFTLVAFLGVATQRLTKARADLSQLNANLESQVQERTAALNLTNHDLEFEITERKQTGAALNQAKVALEEAQRLARLGSWQWEIATDTVIWSEELYRIFDRDPNRPPPTYQEHPQIYTAESMAQLDAAVAQTINHGIPYAIDLELIRPDGSTRWIIGRGEPQYGAHRQVIGLRGTCIDITDRKRMEEALRLSLADAQRHDFQMIALNRMDDLLLACETRQDAHAIIAQSARVLFDGYAGGLAVKAETAPVLHLVADWGEDHRLLPQFSLPDCWALRYGEPYQVTDPAHGILCQHFATPPEYPYLCLPLTVRGEILGLLHVSTRGPLFEERFFEGRNLVIKVSESIKLALSNLYLREALREQTIRDPLTGLFNRRYLDETLHRELHRCQRNDEPLAVAMLDIDHFKHFNDAYGHDAGDAVLRAIGDLLKGFLRAGDIACRYGGEELTVILPGSTLDDARIRLDSLRCAIMQLRVIYKDDDLPTITVSIGVASAGEQDVDAVTLLARADAALYQAKESGRNRVVVAGLN